jgi:gliding motility-associated-like protein
MKKLLPVIFILSFYGFSAVGQQVITACCDDTICTPGDAVQLTSTVDSGSTGSILVIADDTYSQVVNLGFSFVYFGVPYTKCILSTNNYISFDTTQALLPSPWPINDPIPSPANPVNSIMGPWHDTDPSVPPFGVLSFGTFGTAPNRFFVFSFCKVPMYGTSEGCNDQLFTGQIIIYETTNIIEMHLGEKPVCEAWNNGAAIQGLQNQDGSQAVVVPGRNYPEVWTAINDGQRFTPNGNTYTISTIPYAPVPFSAGDPQWFDGDGNFVGSGSTITVHPTATTQYIATVASCAYNADTVTITVDTLSGDYSSVNPHCPNIPEGSITASASGNFGPNTFVWTNANGDTLRTRQNAISDSVVNLVDGTYTVTITNSIGCVITNTYTLTSPPFSAAFSISPAEPCDGSPVTFTNLSTGTVSTNAWTFGDGSGDSNSSPTHTFPAAGDYTVQLIISSLGGCIDTASQVITINPNITVSFTEDAPPYCVGVPVQFSDVTDGHPSTWSWDFGDGNTSDVQNPSHSFSNPDTFLVQVSVTDSFCGSGQYAASIIVNFVPDPQLREDTMLCPNELLVLNANAEGTSYLWSTGATTQEIQIPAPAAATYYSVIVDNYGCTGTDSVLITSDCLLFLPSAFSPNGDGTNDMLRALGSHLSDYKLTIYNRWGQEVYDREGNNLLDGWDGTFDGEPQDIGVYVYVLKGTFVSGEPVSRIGNVTLVR